MFQVVGRIIDFEHCDKFCEHNFSLFFFFVYDKKLTLRRLMSCIYGAPILDVSRSHTTTQHSR